MDLDLAGRVALVAGGGRGIGRACALALAREGADVAVLARTASELDSTADAVRALGRRALALPCDATDLGALDAAFDRVARELAAPTLLVLSTAALWQPQKLQYISDADARALLDADVSSAVALCRRALPAMVDARFGRIVGLGSVAARTGIAGGALYAAGKAALEGLLRGVALDYGRRGITANVVAVAFADTERLRARTAGDAAARERLERATATRAIPTPEQIADVVAFLSSPRAAAVTGAVVDATAGGHLNNLW
jgi:NAD(P)-dependent dehydrogenase (short-subunit alcohol dehydrogenase family)